MDFSSIWQQLNGIVFGEQREEWAAADDAGRADMLREAGLDEVAPEDLTEAVSLACGELPPEQVALLAPVSQVASVEVGGTTPAPAPSPGPAPAPSPGPAPAPAPSGGGTSGGGSPAPAPSPGPAPAPTPPPPPPVDPTLDPVEQLVQHVNYYVTNVETNIDQSVTDNSVTNIDDRDTNIDNSTDVGMINNLGGEVTFDNDVQTAGDGAIQIGEGAGVGAGAQLNTGDGAVQNQGDGDVNAITGDVTDSTIVQDTNVHGNVTGDVGDGAIVNDGGDLTGVNTGEVGGNMVTADDGSFAAGDDQALHNQGPVSQGEGDAIQSHGNVNTGEGDQTNIDFDQNNGGFPLREVRDEPAELARERVLIEEVEPGRGTRADDGGDAGGDVNFNIGDGTQTVVDNETDIDLSTTVHDSVVDSENVAQAEGGGFGREGGGDAIANDEGNVANEALQIADNTLDIDNSQDHSVDHSTDVDLQLGLAGEDVVQTIEDPAPLPADEPAMDEMGE